MNENKDIALYFVTKHSWKGKYKRIFSVGTHGITTYHPTSMENTNQWPYKEFSNIQPLIKANINTNEFVITIKKGNKKSDQMKFSSDHRADILTEALKFRRQFTDPPTPLPRYNAMKYHWSGNKIPVILTLCCSSLDQIDLAGRNLASYNYKDIAGICCVSDVPNAFVIFHGNFGRKHMFISDRRDEIIKSITDTANSYIGVLVQIKKTNFTLQGFLDNRFGIYSKDEALTSVCEFTVHKITNRQEEQVKRLLCLTESCLLERDPATYCITTLRPLSDVFAIIRCPQNPQVFYVEYISGHIRKYTSANRDALLASLLDGVRASGNKDVHVKMALTNRGQRLGPLVGQMDEEVESCHLKFLQTPPSGWDFAEAIFRFNNNIPYSGLLHSISQEGLFSENKEKLITSALSSLIDHEGDQENITIELQEAQFHSLHRLVSSKVGFAAFTEIPKFREKLGAKVVKSLKRNNEGVAHAAIDMLCCLMQPMHDNYDLRQEQLNKSSLLSSKSFLESLLELMVAHINSGTGALLVSSMLDFLTFALCTPYSDTTDGTLFDTLLKLMADHGRSLFSLFQHPSMAIVKGAGLVMKAIIEEGDAEIAAKMQELSLAEGALPRHLHIALFTQRSDSRLLALLQLSRNLVTLWVTGNTKAIELFNRVLPLGMLRFLKSTEKVPAHALDKFQIRDNLKMAQDHSNKFQSRLPPSLQVIEKQIDLALQHWRSRIGLEIKKDEKLQQRPIVLRKHRQRIKSDENWDMFYYQFYRDHATPDLLWNFKTRDELKDALEDEIRKFQMDLELSRNAVISWNYDEFEVRYPSLSEEIKVGDYYLRLLLEEDEKEFVGTSYIQNSKEFFNDLYHRFLLTIKPSLRAMCLHALAIIYGKFHEEIGAFKDTRFMVVMLEKSNDKSERDRLILFISKLIYNKKNVKDLIDANGLRIMVDLLTLAHLHTSRAVIPTQNNVIEASPDMESESEKEWFYQSLENIRGAEGGRHGPYSFKEMKQFFAEDVIIPKTKIWAQGMEGWRAIQFVPQMKWNLLATGNAILNESELANHILTMMIRICEYYPSRNESGAIIRPLPRAKMILSDSSCLPHIVQLLLTFDPVLVEKVAILVYEIMTDNPNLPRLYQSGFFFFILMYTGSNVLPIGKMLKASHMCQSFRVDDAQSSSSIMQRSILGQLLPEAMVCYLENHGPKKFAEIFLGEFDTPEAIWNHEMRRLMIEKIAVHLADFTPRLPSNTRAVYGYCAIPVIQFPQLECELFCNIYYLRHLCDIQRFPDWPILEPFKLLKDVLEAWKQEIEKKPSELTVEEAYEVLNLSRENASESNVRKAYFKLAQKYHPDKNPEGRDMFEKVNKAYEFICSRSSRSCEGPDPINITLILKTQSILFKRYREELHPYRYSGYPMLIQTIVFESKDDHLFSKPDPLLANAAECCFHTVNCSPLNVEELRRNGGLEILKEAFTRCIAVINKSSKMDDLPVLVAIHITRCFAVASQFSASREKLIDMPDMIKDLCRILYYKHLYKLCAVVVECMSAFAVDEILQTHLFQTGVLYHLLLFFFQYDFTLDEGGVDKAEETNQQEIANQLAKLSVIACGRLAGYIEKTPQNNAVRRALDKMLTPYIVKQFDLSGTSEVLKLLNCNTENPYLIWNNGTRAELNEYVEAQRDEKIRSGECDPTLGAEFVFKAYEKELIIGDIFVRIFNRQPTFPLENANEFTFKLLDFLGSEAQYLHSMLSLAKSSKPGTISQSQKRLVNIEMALEALKNVILNNPAVVIQCIGHFKLLFSLLRLDSCPKVQEYTIQAVAGVTGNQECVKDIAASEVLVYLLLVLHSYLHIPSQTLVLETLLPLMANTQLVKDAMNKGIVIYVLNLFCNSTNFVIRELSAALLGKIMTDKLNGPKIRINLAKFLPALFLDAMKDFPATAIQLFEGCQENPELIWKEDSRKSLCQLITEMANNHFKIQRDNPTNSWNPPQESVLTLPEHDGELIVGGVYLRLFIQNPSYTVRKPREFLNELLDKFQVIVSKPFIDGDTLETVTLALVSLFQAQSTILELLPAMGHIPQIIKILDNQNGSTARSCLLLLHELVQNEACIKSLAKTDVILPLMKAVQNRKDLAGVACESLNKMFQSANEELSQQAVEVKLVSFLLNLLESKLDVVNPTATKAQIVQALTALSLSSKCGEHVQTLLQKSTIWAEYKDQKHDLFITETPMAGYLTAGTPAVAGYLTQGSTKIMPSSPPPMDS